MVKNFCIKVAKSKLFNLTIIGTILIASIVVGAQTYKEFATSNARLLSILDGAILSIFIIEIIVKILAKGNKPQDYFKNGWNVFDFSIVMACLLEPMLNLGGEFLPVLRLARILRVLKLVTAIPKLQLLVGCLLKSLPSMFYVSILLFILFYVYGTMGVFLCSENDPIHFRNLQTSILSLFRIVTLEDWTDIMYTNMYGSYNYGYSEEDLVKWNPSSNESAIGAAVYFVSFVLIGTMIVLNLVIGVIMNSMEESNSEIKIKQELNKRKSNPDPLRNSIEDMHDQMKGISNELEIIKKMLDKKENKKER